MADAVGFGILGSGNMARVYGDALATQVPGGALRAIMGGRNAASLAAEFGVAVEAAPEALFRRPDVEVVVIATPHSSHRDLALGAAAAGKHVYLEKPMALNVAECDEIIAACRRAGVQLTVAKQSRHFEMSLRSKRFIDEGLIGDIRYLRPMSVIPSTASVAKFVADSHWQYPLEGDAFLDWGSHCCDAIRWMTGAEPVRVYADYENFDGIDASKPDGQTSAIQFRLSNRAIAQILLSYDVPPSNIGSGRNNQYLVVGSEGSIFWDLDRCELVTGDRESRIWELPSWTIPDFKPRDPRRIGNTARQVQGFVEDLLAGRPPRVTGQDGRAAIEMTQAASLSAARHQVVEFPLAAA
jgi:predicted dehydrogenase